VFAEVVTNLTASYLKVEDRVPPVPVVVSMFPKCIICPAFWAIFQPPTPFPTISMTEPKAAVPGKVNVTSDALFATYPVFTAIA
jgi:hypothetical protein